MPTRPLPPVIGSTENALRTLLQQILAKTEIGGYDKWIYLNISDTVGDPDRTDELVVDALNQEREVVMAARLRLVDTGMLDTAGSLTPAGQAQLSRGRALVSSATQALTAGIDTAALQTTIDTLDTVRVRAETQLRT